MLLKNKKQIPLSLLVLAAGMGSRYGSLKQLEIIGPSGETIMDYSIYDAINAGFTRVVFVIQKSFEKEFQEKIFIKYQNIVKVDCVFQEIDVFPDYQKPSALRKKPWGTAHAVLMAKEVIHEPFTVINADDFYGANSYKIMAEYLSKLTDKTQNTYALLAYKLKNTLSKNGSVSRGICQIDQKSFLTSIVEHTKIGVEQNQIYSSHATNAKEILSDELPTSMNFIGFTPSVFEWIEHFFKIFLEKNTEDLDAEFFLPFLVSEIINKKKGKVKVLSSNEKWYGVTYFKDKEWVKKNIRFKINRGEYPKKLFVDGQ